jgi:ABC-type transport system involved in multi-copper enzyme maturation permease subunit
MLRLETRRALFGKRAIAVYLLAALPVAWMSLWALVVSRGVLRNVGNPEPLFAQVFQGFILRFVIFFGCAWIFTNLFRGETLDRSLHYYFLSPIRRERLVAGKYVAGLLASLLVFVACTATCYLLLWAPYGSDGVETIMMGTGLTHLLQYCGVAALACLGYGAVFLMASVFLRNPMIPAVVLLLWESINFLLPPVLKKLSVIHYLVSLCPVAISEGPFAVVAEPTPWWVTLPGLLVLTGLALWAATRKVRRSEILYGTD